MTPVQFKYVGQIELLDGAIPKVSPRRVLLKGNAASICGTDAHELEGKIPIQFPPIPGHGFAGTIEKVGPGMTKVAKGDRVVVKPSFAVAYVAFDHTSQDSNVTKATGSMSSGFQHFPEPESDAFYAGKQARRDFSAT